MSEMFVGSKEKKLEEFKFNIKLLIIFATDDPNLEMLQMSLSSGNIDSEEFHLYLMHFILMLGLEL